jgi:hypothetical protein
MLTEIFQNEVEIRNIDYKPVLEKYFLDYYPFPLKNRVKGAQKPREFCFDTTRLFAKHLKRLATEHNLSRNKYMVQILSQKMYQILSQLPPNKLGGLFSSTAPDGKFVTVVKIGATIG